VPLPTDSPLRNALIGLTAPDTATERANLRSVIFEREATASPAVSPTATPSVQSFAVSGRPMSARSDVPTTVTPTLIPSAAPTPVPTFVPSVGPSADVNQSKGVSMIDSFLNAVAPELHGCVAFTLARVLSSFFGQFGHTVQLRDRRSCPHLGGVDADANRGPRPQTLCPSH
jgi:hypothetical protein